MTVIYEDDLDILKIYPHIKNGVSDFQQLEHEETDTQTHTQTRPNAIPSRIRGW